MSVIPGSEKEYPGIAADPDSGEVKRRLKPLVERNLPG